MKQYYEYYYNLSVAHFISDMDCMFMDKNKYQLATVSKVAGNDLMVTLYDLERIYGPYMELTEDENGAKIEMDDIVAEVKPGCNKIKVNGEIKEMAVPAAVENGKIIVPVGDFMKLAFDKFIASSNDPATPIPAFHWKRDNFVIAVCDKYEYKDDPNTHRIAKTERESFQFDIPMIQSMNLDLMGKVYGEFYKTYWFEDAKKVMTYSAYVPTGYDPSKPSKLVVQLHGGGLGEQAIYSLSKNMVQFWTERYNYLYIAPNACTKNSTYGDLYFTGPGVNIENPDLNSDNPFGFSEDEITKRKLGEKGILLAIEAIAAEYNVDREHIYLMGNSMGGLGTFHLGNTYPEIFRAIAPFGIGLDLRLLSKYDYTNTPIRIVGGTEDYHGYVNIRNTYKALKEKGFDVELATVGGGVHYDAWAYVLEDTFKFFDKHA